MKVHLQDALNSARDTKELVLGSGALAQCGRVFQQQFHGKNAVIVADARTYGLAGESVMQSLANAGVSCLQPFIFRDPNLHAEFRFVEQLEISLKRHEAIPIAVGAGTLNDLTKLAAHRCGRDGYLCVASAASMDGYTAFGASITFQGAKQTFHCPAPRAVVADFDIIRRAPPEMTASGYADMAAKITAGADWILADALGLEKIDPRAWEIVQGGLGRALADPAGARAGQESAIYPLVEGLMMGGFAMQWAKSSRPASGAEHQFSHLWDMEHHTHNGVAPSHGFKVGVATLAMTRFYEALLEIDFSTFDIPNLFDESEEQIREMFSGADFVETAVTETRAKAFSIEQARSLKIKWPVLKEKLRHQLLPSTELESRLKLVGAPTNSVEIGISRQRLKASFKRAYHIRRRFTALDLAVRTGVLDEVLDKVFA